MKPLTAAAVSFSLLAIVLSWTVLFGLYPGYRADALRHRLTVLRHELLDLAAAGLVPFTHPAYLHLRAVLQTAVHGAEHLTLSRMALLALARRLFPGWWSHSGLDPWESRGATASVAGMSPHLASIQERLELLIARHMVSGSPLGWLLVLGGAIRSLASGRSLRLCCDPRRLLPGADLLALAIQTSGHCARGAL